MFYCLIYLINRRIVFFIQREECCHTITGLSTCLQSSTNTRSDLFDQTMPCTPYNISEFP